MTVAQDDISLDLSVSIALYPVLHVTAHLQNNALPAPAILTSSSLSVSLHVLLATTAQVMYAEHAPQNVPDVPDQLCSSASSALITSYCTQMLN